MRKNILYLHVGWSKTGTTAIQTQAHLNHELLLEAGLLYPQFLQWADHSHHPFAFAFKPAGQEQYGYTPDRVLKALQTELEQTTADNVLISSEVSPFYFQNEIFREFVSQHFSQIKIIFTIRRQSEFILSLFNQMVKDPDIRFYGSLFFLAIHNYGWMDYYSHIKMWEHVVGKENIYILGYSQDIVQNFFQALNIDSTAFSNPTQALINTSLPTRSLVLVQERGKVAQSNEEFIQIRQKILNQLPQIPSGEDTHILFKASEQWALENQFRFANTKLGELSSYPYIPFAPKEFEDIKVIPAFHLTSNHYGL